MRKHAIARIFSAAVHFFTALGLADVNLGRQPRRFDPQP